MSIAARSLDGRVQWRAHRRSFAASSLASSDRRERIPTGRKRRGLLVADLNELDLLLPCAECFEDAVDSITRETEDRIHFPRHEPFDQEIGYG
jgi:hypothetical protein